MAILSNASPEEKLSPFYDDNEKFCKEFERFVAVYNGFVKGKYNAFSYYLVGKITNPSNWKLIYKKSTLTSTGNLWLSSKRQSLFASAEWITSRISASDSEFLIRKKSKFDYIKLLFDKRFSVFEIVLITLLEQ